jgi:hypothetical protein
MIPARAFLALRELFHEGQSASNATSALFRAKTTNVTSAPGIKSAMAMRALIVHMDKAGTVAATLAGIAQWTQPQLSRAKRAPAAMEIYRSPSHTPQHRTTFVQPNSGWS